jgi:hypothetical protein
MPWLELTHLVAYGLLAAGVLFLIWSLVRGSISVLGLGFLIVGLLLELLTWFIELVTH